MRTTEMGGGRHEQALRQCVQRSSERAGRHSVVMYTDLCVTQTASGGDLHRLSGCTGDVWRSLASKLDIKTAVQCGIIRMHKCIECIETRPATDARIEHGAQHRANGHGDLARHDDGVPGHAAGGPSGVKTGCVGHTTGGCRALYR